MKEELTKKEQKLERMAKMINCKLCGDLQVNCRELCVLTYQTLFNVPNDVKFFKTEAVQYTTRLFTLSRLIDLDKKYLHKFVIQFEDLRSLFRMMFELKIINKGNSFRMCEVFSKVDENLNSLKSV